MVTHYSKCIVFVALTSALAAQPISAQTDDATDAPRFEITPFAGYRFGGHFQEADGDREFDVNNAGMQGIIVNIAARSGGHWEVSYARQNTDVDTLNVFSADPQIGIDIEELHFGGTYEFEGRNARPFIAMTVGATNFEPRPGELRSEDYFSVSIGGGVQLRANKRLGVRLEGRVNATLVDSDSEIFCDSTLSGNGCLIFIDGKTLTQWELRAGVVFRF